MRLYGRQHSLEIEREKARLRSYYINVYADPKPYSTGDRPEYEHEWTLRYDQPVPVPEVGEELEVWGDNESIGAEALLQVVSRRFTYGHHWAEVDLICEVVTLYGDYAEAFAEECDLQDAGALVLRVNGGVIE